MSDILIDRGALLENLKGLIRINSVNPSLVEKWAGRDGDCPIHWPVSFADRT